MLMLVDAAASLLRGCVICSRLSDAAACLMLMLVDAAACLMQQAVSCSRLFYAAACLLQRPA